MRSKTIIRRIPTIDLYTSEVCLKMYSVGRVSPPNKVMDWKEIHREVQELENEMDWGRANGEEIYSLLFLSTINGRVFLFVSYTFLTKEQHVFRYHDTRRMDMMNTFSAKNVLNPWSEL